MTESKTTMGDWIKSTTPLNVPHKRKVEHLSSVPVLVLLLTLGVLPVHNADSAPPPPLLLKKILLPKASVRYPVSLPVGTHSSRASPAGPAASWNRWSMASC